MKTYRSQEKTQKLIDELREREETEPEESFRWTYIFEAFDNGLAVIKAYDEEYEFVGYL